jgi:hypothetical protein
MEPWITLRVAMLDRAAALHFFVAEPASIAAPICYRVFRRSGPNTPSVRPKSGDAVPELWVAAALQSTG